MASVLQQKEKKGWGISCSDYMWGKVVEARCGIDVALASTASPVPHAVKCAVLCVTWCIQLQCVGYLFPALLIYCSFWSSSSIILLPIIGVFTFTKILILRILKCLTTWCFQKKKTRVWLGYCRQQAYHTSKSTQHAEAEWPILRLQNLCSCCESTIVQVTAWTNKVSAGHYLTD